MTKYKWFLVATFLIFWIWAAINPLYRDGWLLENYLIFFFVPVIFICGRYFKLSNISYTLITIFMICHVIGSHYTYAEMPYGWEIGSWFGSERNMYDRLVHFFYGFLLAYPIREIFMRLVKSKGFWSYYFPIEITAAASALYEIIEWIAAIRVSPEEGLAFLGSQGDIWDAQKDMALATVGAIIAMLIVAIINWHYNKKFGKEMKDSFKIAKGDHPLGEEKLKEYWQEKVS